MVTLTPAVGLTGVVAAMSLVGVWLRICWEMGRRGGLDGMEER